MAVLLGLIICAPPVLALRKRHQLVPDRARRRLALLRTRMVGRGNTYPSWSVAGMVAAYLVFFASAVADDHTSGPVQKMARTCLATSALIGAVCSIWVFLHLRRYGRRVKAFLDEVERGDYRVCFKCLYSLQGLGDVERCPECGSEFTYAQLREGWSDVVKLGRRK